jgi:hypothetical protein
MREKSLPAIAKQSAFALAGLVLAATISAAGASTPTGSASASTRAGVQQFVKVAEAVAVTKPGYARKTNLSHKKPRRSQKTWLNPQPEPPMGPAKVNQGNTWLNPQPEPPRPAARTKNLR